MTRFVYVDATFVWRADTFRLIKSVFIDRSVISARKDFRFDAQHWRKFSSFKTDTCSRFARNIKLLFSGKLALLIAMMLKTVDS